MNLNPHESPDGEPADRISLRRVAAALLWFFGGFAAFVAATLLAMQFGLWMRKG